MQSRFLNFGLIRRGPLPALLATLVAAALTTAATLPALAATQLTGKLYFTTNAGDPNVYAATFNYDGTHFSLSSTPTYSVPAADGLVFSPDGDILVGGQGDAVYKLNPRNGQYVTSTAGGGTAYHMSLDPSGTKVWATGIPGQLTEVPLTPFANGTPHDITGDDAYVTSISFVPNGPVFYTAGGSGGGGGFGTIDLTTFTTKQLFSLPAAHGLVYDGYSGMLMLFGADHITQIDPNTLQVVSDFQVRGGSFQLDQGTVDGAGHLFVCSNNGQFIFMDYSVTKRVASAGNFVSVQDTGLALDDVAPMFGPGAPRLPDAPTNLQATAGTSTEIDLTWNDRSNNEKGFEIQRQTGSGAFVTVTVTNVNVTSYADRGLQPNTTYSYRVRSTNGVGDSAWTATATAATVVPPAAPTGLSVAAVPLSSTSLQLSWTDNADNETGFRIERSTAGGAFVELSSQAPANAGTFTDTGLQPSTTYAYRVRATNAGGNSAYSNTATATTPPAAPSNLVTTALSTTSIQLSWTDNSPDEAGFKIERRTGTGAFTALPVVAANGTSTVTFVDTGLAPGTAYTYHVRASNANGDSANSSDVTATTLQPGKISVAPTKVNLGAVKVGAAKTGHFQIKNLGAGPLHVTVPAGSGAFTAAPVGGSTILPKKSLTVNVTFRPTAKSAASGSLTVSSDDPARPSVTISLSGIGK